MAQKPKPSAKPGVKARLTVRRLGSGDWPVVMRLFGNSGACGGCWCMWWRVPKGGKTWEQSKGKKNRERFRRLIEAGKVHGVIAFAGNEPVGWCSFGPRPAFPRLERVKALRRENEAGTEVWSIVCFYIPARWRGRGVASALAAAATREAFRQGARRIEAYPIVPKRERAPAAFVWTGVPALFQKAGYQELPRPEASRPIYVVDAKR